MSPLPNSGLFQPKQETVAGFTALEEEESNSLGSLSLHRQPAGQASLYSLPSRLLLLPQLMTCTFKVVL